MAIILAGAVAALVAILLALTGHSAARRLLAGMSGLIAGTLLAIWLFHNY
jgi:hypothetical protein